jgi:hypothetical protein
MNLIASRAKMREAHMADIGYYLAGTDDAYVNRAFRLDVTGCSVGKTMQNFQTPD